MGYTTGQDFLRFVHTVSKLEGGAFLNLGSAVMGPEVYLKSLSMARNVAHQRNEEIRNFLTANFDLIDFRDFRDFFYGQAAAAMDSAIPSASGSSRAPSRRWTRWEIESQRISTCGWQREGRMCQQGRERWRGNNNKIKQ